ncbi:MAG TPA: hypothetical protein VGT08_05125 [Terracidiphilus sp.]|nr:hypothetical protein [Terracidiphilus sp.]
MSRDSEARLTWSPQSNTGRDAILDELHRIVGSSHFCNSKRYPALLQYIVENTLSGRLDQLKERSIGIEVFGRPASFDSNTDTVVRFTAGEVRKRLALYYSEHGRGSRLRISIPTGSYVAEFSEEEEAEGHDNGDSAPISAAPATKEVSTPPAHEPAPNSAPLIRHWRIALLILLVLAASAAAGFYGWRSKAIHSENALEDFWAPVLKDQHSVILCTGSVIFDKNKASGVTTAGRDVDYPFVSMQNSLSISEVQDTVARFGVTSHLVFSAITPVTDLQEHTVVLIGAYNNDLTLRLVQQLRYRYIPEPHQRIVDSMHPNIYWERDPTLPYSSADDYAMVARFRDPATAGWMVVLGGVGRNGTEAAAQFVSDPHHLELLQKAAGGRLAERNLQAVLKVNVIEGKTGAPEILAIYTW